MGDVRRVRDVKLIVGLISGDTALFDKARTLLEKSFKNRVDIESGIFDFTHTAYYGEELGAALKRKFLSFERPVPLKRIEKVKLISNKLERALSRGRHARTVNIDPGYLDLSKLVLFSTKDYSHRIHVANGIYAEVTLYFKDAKFNAWPWTYPDYRTNDYINVFNAIRQRFKEQLAKAG
jgi:hypothetical protein